MFSRTTVAIAVMATLISWTIPVKLNAQGDEKARRLAEATIDQMGGLKEWNDHRFLVWDIFGETHYWDKWSGDFRWESDSLVVLTNIRNQTGRAWIEGTEVKVSKEKTALLDRAYERWVNNSYWLLMPYKLLDPGVNLRYVGTDTAETGQVSDVIELTFDNVGLTPNNRFQVFIDKKTGMVCQWAYFRNREDTEPGFIRPWNQWEKYDGMWMSTGRGDDRHNISNLALPENLPGSVFTDPGPVAWHR